jgi:ABC-2 type transport system permease protein
MGRILALLEKEWSVLFTDVHGLFALFVMPPVFILIMSLALQDTLGGGTRRAVPVLLADRDGGALAVAVGRRLGGIEGFAVVPTTAPDPAIEAELRADRAKFAVVLPHGWSEALSHSLDEQPLPIPEVVILMAPSVTPDLAQLFRASALGVAQQVLTQFLIRRLAGVLDRRPTWPAPAFVQRYAYGHGAGAERPTAVQQSVPAWLVFSMFFVVIPISTTYLVERQQGTLLRLRAIGIPAHLSLLAKVPPYYLVNQIQMVLMILVGMYLVPLFGGGALQPGSSFGGLLLISGGTSLAAIGFALMVSVFARTSVQATTLGGIANIVFGALGGVMVPTFIMPPAMQTLSQVSPMSWAMEGFLDIFLRGGGWLDVWPEAAALASFGCLCLGIAVVIFNR